MGRAVGPTALLDHLAVWPALYAAAVVLAWIGLTPDAHAGSAARVAATATLAALAGWSAFTVDRVKLRDRWLDPADRDAHPARFAFVAARARPLRAGVAVATAAASALALLVLESPLLVALPPAVVAGTACYAPWPRSVRPRVKDRLLVKNLAVGAAFAGFAWTIGRLADGGPLAAPSVAEVVVASILALRVAADAALCDLDDAAADLRHGTRTLATALGPARAFRLAIAARVATALALAGIAATGLVPGGPALALSVAGLVGIALLAAAAGPSAARPSRRVGPLVDAGFAAEVSLALAVAWFAGA